MLVRFTLNNTSFSELGALYSAIYNIATCAANTNPSKPTGVNEWEILNNTVAGGWSPLTGVQSTSLVVSSGSSYSGALCYLVAPTSKTGVYKSFELFTQGATTYTTYGVVLARMSQYNGSSITSTTKVGSSVAIGATTTSGSSCNSLLGASGGPYWCGTFYVSATVNSIWIYCTGSGNLIGCGDLSAGAAYDYDTKSLHFPAAGLISSGAASTASQAASDYSAIVSVCNFQRGETSYDYNDLWGTTTQTISIPGITTGTYTKNMEATPFLPVLPAFGTVLADNSSYKSTWSTDGYYRYSVNDISLFNPWQGYPVRTIAGLKLIGWDRYNTNLPPALQNMRIQVDTQKYFCVTQGTGGRVIFGMIE